MDSLPNTFRPMLSAGINNPNDFDRLTFGTYVGSPKLDGIRMLIHPDKGAVTRSLKPIRNIKLRSYLERLVEAVPEVAGLDGEITALSPGYVTHPEIFNWTTRSVMSAYGDPRNNPHNMHTYWLFDKFWDPAHPKAYQENYNIRHEAVQRTIAKIQKFEHAFMTDKQIPLPALCTELESVPLYAKGQVELREEYYVDAGYEGLMLRDPDKPYKFGRSALTNTQQHLIKIKRFIDEDAEIIGFEELMHNDNAQTKDEFGLAERSSHKANLRPGNTLGKLVCKAITGRFEGVSFRIGTGFDQATRQKIWDNQQAYLGLKVKFKYQDIGSKDAPRIPVFHGFRED